MSIEGDYNTAKQAIFSFKPCGVSDKSDMAAITEGLLVLNEKNATLKTHSHKVTKFYKSSFYGKCMNLWNTCFNRVVAQAKIKMTIIEREKEEFFDAAAKEALKKYPIKLQDSEGVGLQKEYKAEHIEKLVNLSLRSYFNEHENMPLDFELSQIVKDAKNTIAAETQVRQYFGKDREKANKLILQVREFAQETGQMSLLPGMSANGSKSGIYDELLSLKNDKTVSTANKVPMALFRAVLNNYGFSEGEKSYLKNEAEKWSGRKEFRLILEQALENLTTSLEAEGVVREHQIIKIFPKAIQEAKVEISLKNLKEKILSSSLTDELADQMINQAKWMAKEQGMEDSLDKIYDRLARDLNSLKGDANAKINTVIKALVEESKQSMYAVWKSTYKANYDDARIKSLNDILKAVDKVSLKPGELKEFYERIKKTCEKDAMFLIDHGPEAVPFYVGLIRTKRERELLRDQLILKGNDANTIDDWISSIQDKLLDKYITSNDKINHGLYSWHEEMTKALKDLCKNAPTEVTYDESAADSFVRSAVENHPIPLDSRALYQEQK